MAQQTTKYPGRRWRGNACRLTGCIAASLACIPLLIPPAASAQGARPSPAQAIEEGLRRQNERAQELQQRLLPGAYMPQPELAAPVFTTLPEEQPCFTINAVELKSADAVRFGWLADTALPFLHQCAGVHGLRQIAAALDAKLIALGYITSRVTLPELLRERWQRSCLKRQKCPDRCLRTWTALQILTKSDFHKIVLQTLSEMEQLCNRLLMI
jgi:hypothetical protein